MREQQCKRTSQLVLWYREYLDDGKSAAFVSRVATRYTLGTLSRMSDGHEAELRRASVLALGMLGGGDCLSAIAKRLRDDDRCVRLVAEIAFCDLSRRQVGMTAAMELDSIRRHVDGHRYRKSLTLLKSMTKRYPQFAEAWYLLGIVEFCLGRYQRAIEASTQAIDLNRDHFLAYSTIGRSWLELEDSLRALRAFEKSFAINRSQVGVKGYIDVLLRQTRRMKDKS